MKKILLIFTLILLTGFVIANPPMPSAFYGEINLDGGILQNGYFITAKVSNLDNVECTIINGKYGYEENTCIVLSDQENVLIEFFS